MKSVLIALAFSVWGLLPAHAGAAVSTSGKVVETPTGFMMVLRQGDDVIAHLEALAREKNLRGASFSGIGFVKAEFGYWNRETKTFDPKKTFEGELASLNGSIAWEDGEPSIHAHGVVTGEDFLAHGGHILGMEVGTGSVELTILAHSQRFARKVDESIGAKVLEFAD